MIFCFPCLLIASQPTNDESSRVRSSHTSSNMSISTKYTLLPALSIPFHQVSTIHTCWNKICFLPWNWFEIDGVSETVLVNSIFAELRHDLLDWVNLWRSQSRILDQLFVTQLESFWQALGWQVGRTEKFYHWYPLVVFWEHDDTNVAVFWWMVDCRSWHCALHFHLSSDFLAIKVGEVTLFQNVKLQSLKKQDYFWLIWGCYWNMSDSISVPIHAYTSTIQTAISFPSFCNSCAVLWSSSCEFCTAPVYNAFLAGALSCLHGHWKYSKTKENSVKDATSIDRLCVYII